MTINEGPALPDEYALDLFWHALNYRGAIIDAEPMWQELSACVERLIAAAVAEERERRSDAVATLKDLHARLLECMALGLTAAEAYDSFYQENTLDILAAEA